MLIIRILIRLSKEIPLFFISPPKITKKGLIVSFTSYPARLSKLHLVVRSLLRQSLKPEKIILYLGNDTKPEDIPDNLLKLQKYNFEIKTGKNDIKPHKKYLFAMQEFPEHTIITVDDDLIYDKNLIKDLVETSNKHTGCICARRVNLMRKDKQGNLAKYSEWDWEYKNLLEPSHALLATGCGGILYPAKCFGPEAFYEDAIINNCLNTDDIWLKFMEIKYDRKVVFTNSKIIHPLTIRNSQKNALMQNNTKGENRNDINIKNMEEYTGIKLKDYAIPFEKKQK